MTEQLVPQALVGQHGHVQLSQQHLLRPPGGFLDAKATQTGESALPCSNGDLWEERDLPSLTGQKGPVPRIRLSIAPVKRTKEMFFPP